jgi:Ribonuclease G/E
VSGELLLACAPGEVRAAWIEAGRLVDLAVERENDEGSLVGAVFLGRVTAVLPKLPGALVEIGRDRPALLRFADLPPVAGDPPITRRLQEGQAILVRITRDAVEGKGPVLERAAAAEPPKRLDRPAGPVERALAAFLPRAPHRIVIDDPAAFAEIRGLVARLRPDLVSIVERHDPAEGRLLDRHNAADAVEQALRPLVPLPGGGEIVIETTTACTTVDVDLAGMAAGRGSADRAILETNLRAAAEIARQLRLRSLGGPVVIDFVSMRSRADRDAVAGAFAEAVRSDPMPVQVLGWTRLGHLEAIRRRGRAGLAQQLLDGGTPPRRTAFTVALEALAAVAEANRRHPLGPAPTLIVHPEVLAALEGQAAPAYRLLERRLGGSLRLQPDPLRPRDSFELVAR